MWILPCGLRLAGIETIVIHEQQEILQQMEQVKKQKEIGILVITYKIYNKAKKEWDEWQQENVMPLMIKIPDRHGS